MPNTTPLPGRCLVTGGGGFLGFAIVRRLLDEGAAAESLRSVSRGDYPALAERGVEHIRADLAEPGVAERAVDGVDTVFHVAAKAGVWGPRDDYVRSNLTATRQLLEACRSARVKRFVYTSSPSVVFAMNDQRDVDESAPYPSRFYTHYSATKAQAEQEVLAANGPAMAAVALRPHLIVGPGDPHLVPRIVERARTGQLRQIGAGDNEADLTDVDDAARAHLLAAATLAERGHEAPCAGRAYFITQGEPVNLWTWVRELLAALDAPPPGRAVSYGMAYTAGALLEGAYRLLGVMRREPKMTRFVAAQLAKSHTYTIEAARRDFGYEPSRPMAEVTARIVEALRNPAEVAQPA